MNEPDSVLRLLLEIEGGEHWSESDFRSELAAEGSRCFLWTPASTQTVAGFVLCRVGPDPSDEGLEAWIMNLAVRRRGQGQGKQLWTAFEDWLRSNEPLVRRIGLEVAAANAPAVGLYEASGFQLVGIRKNYYKNSDDARVYSKALRNG